MEWNGERHLSLYFCKIDAEYNGHFIVDYYCKNTKMSKVFQFSVIEIPSLFSSFLEVVMKNGFSLLLLMIKVVLIF